ncbi:unnamed protein product, partial [Brassica oleracea]
MILIDGQGTVIQGFIPLTRIDTYLPHMVAGSLYRLNKFYGSKSKTVYRVAEQDVTIAFSWNSVLSVLENSRVQFLEDRFRFYSYEEFEAACDFKGIFMIIDETTNYIASVIPTLDDVTSTDLDIIVKVTDYNPQAWSRIDLDVYTIDLRSNRREPNSGEENDICAICHHGLSA